MKVSEIRTMDDGQLEGLLTDLHSEWRHHRFDEAVGKLTLTSRIREIRKDMARIHTIRREREIDAAIDAGEPLPGRRGRRK